MNETIALIPAHMQSIRFPGKALAELAGVPTIILCAQNTISAGLQTWVCTDSEQIIDVCEAWKIPVIRTGNFKTGTDRCTWAAKQLCAKKLLILQGDEPLIHTRELQIFAKLADSSHSNDIIINGLTQINREKAHDQNNVKALLLNDCRIQYLSRLPLKSKLMVARAASTYHGLHQLGYYKQLGLYAGTAHAFEVFAKHQNYSALEYSEKIEMMRWIAIGNRLEGVILDTPGISIDTKADLEDAERSLGSRKPENNA